METRQLTPFFSSTFSALFVTFIFIFEHGQNSFSCGPTFDLFWCVKYLNFGQKLPIRTAHHTFLESTQPQVTKNPYHVVPRGEPKKGISSWTNTSVQRRLYPLFQNPTIFCCPLFSENYLNSQVRINKMVNKHTVDYQPSPLQLISRIHPLIFLWTPTPKGFISPESFLNFFLNLYIPPWLWKSFKFIMLRLLENTFVSQKIESVHFYSCPQAKISPRFLPLSPRQKEIAHSSQTAFSEDIFFLSRKGRRELWS